jgi:hypothetical protein
VTPSAWFAATVLAAAGVGGALGVLSRPGRYTGPDRPASVETVLRAVDRGDEAALARALDAAGPARTHVSPWREEVEMATLVAAGDLDALFRFAETPPAAPARARALLWLRARGKTPEDRARASERLAADYPDSWALAPGAERAGGGSR